MLDRGATEQLLAHLATDLSGLLPGLQRYSLAMAGALFDQTQVLRPAFPILDGLARIEQANRGDHGYRRGLLAIGAVEGAFPVPELQPDPSLPPGILHLLLLQLTGDGQEIDALADEAEHRCMEEGQLSPQSARALEAAFKLPVAHARFMTLTDLEAMLRLQLEHFGFLPLWELVDAALHGGGALEVASRVVLSDKTAIDGPRFSWDGKGVTASFETFDHWANLGQGRELPAEQLEEAYGHWLRHYRQFLVTLNAHAVPVTQRLAADDEPLEGSFLSEVSSLTPTADTAAVTEHQDNDLGTLAVSVVEGNQLVNYYPLTAGGLNDLHAAITGSAAGGIAFPGRLLFDPERRRLCGGLL